MDGERHLLHWEPSTTLECQRESTLYNSDYSTVYSLSFAIYSFRAQVDSSGKVSSQLESRLAPTLSVTIGGEIDHFKSAARFGVGIALESANSDLPMDPNAPQPPAPNVPM